MTCSQCGAPMELIRERDYYHCHYCGSYFFPDDSPDGVRILGENHEGLDCPLCRITLNMAVFDDYYRGYRCNRCQGILFNRTAFRKTIELRRALATAPAEPPVKYREEELQRVVVCPNCEERMSNHKYLGPGNIIIDTCDACDLIWLDYGELSRVVVAPGKDRGEWYRDRDVLPQEELDETLKAETRHPGFGKMLIELIRDFLG